jgi:hypothetical protein
LLLSLILGRFLIAGQAKVLFNTISSDGDESAYLALGLALLEEGQVTDGVRPPLYPLLLAPLAERDWAYFTRAKMMTLGLGALTVLVTFLVTRALFNVETGLLAAFLLAANREFHLRASTVYADTLLVLFFVAAWYFLIKSFEQRRFAYLAGFFVGLAYLTKGTGTLLLVAWGLVAVFHYRGRIFRQKQLLLVPLVFLVTVSPLLIYNLAVFGRPFYNFATSHVMWMDRWAESQVADPANLPTLTSYLQTHSLTDMAERLRFGVTRLNPVLARTLIPSRQLSPGWLGPGLVVVTLMLAGWFVAFRRKWVAAYYRENRLIIQMAVLLFIPFYFFSAWYARVLMESRFLIPILGPFYVLLAAMVITLVQGLGGWLASRREDDGAAGAAVIYRALFYVGVGLVLAWSIWWLITTARVDEWSLAVNPFVSDREANSASETVLAWFERDFPAQSGEARIIFGPSKSLPLWKFPQRFSFERTPVDVNTWPALRDYVAAVSPDYLVIDSDTARRRRDSLSEHFSYRPEGVEFEHIPPGWHLVHLHGEGPYVWAVFQPASPPSRPVTANFANQIELLGYDVIAAGDGPQQTLRLSVHWQALTPLTEDYTMFLHLTAPDGFVKAQRDQQPLNGLWPTSRWSPGEVVADRVEILLDDTVQPNEYLLLAGIYDVRSGRRLPLIDGPSAPSPNAVLLGKIELN